MSIHKTGKHFFHKETGYDIFSFFYHFPQKYVAFTIHVKVLMWIIDMCAHNTN